MKVLVDATFPKTLDGALNLEDLEITRTTESLSDQDLLSSAARDGYAAVVVLGGEFAARPAIRHLIFESQITLICSATEDPIEAERYLTHSFSQMTERVTNHKGEVLWLRKDGLIPES